MKENCLFLLNSPYFDGIGILFEEMVREAKKGNNLFSLDVIETGAYPEIKNFNLASQTLWRVLRRRQFFNSLNTPVEKANLSDIIDDSSVTPSTEIRNIADICLKDHAVCHSIMEDKVQDFIELKRSKTEKDFARLDDGIREYLISNKIDRVIIFNGRNPIARLLELSCTSLDIKMIYLEYFGSQDGKMSYARVPFNLFDLDLQADWILRQYQEADDERVKVAENALENRIDNLDPLLKSWNLKGGTGDEIKQESDLPMISFFFSSEDEYPAIKPSQYGLPDPTRQYDKFFEICSEIKKRGLANDYRWSAKLHPRYTAYKNKLRPTYNLWMKRIQEVRDLGFELDIQSPTASPYPIIENSVLVISFGSTAWEACYFGRPSVMLGPSPFGNHGCCYNAGTIEEVVDYISDIPPALPKETTYPNAWARNQIGKIPKNFVQMRSSSSLFGRLINLLVNRFHSQNA